MQGETNAALENPVCTASSVKPTQDPVWPSSSYVELPQFLDQLILWIKRRPKYQMLWTRGHTLLPQSGHIALDSPHALTLIRENERYGVGLG